jgi:hypothetical protein
MDPKRIELLKNKFKTPFQASAMLKDIAVGVIRTVLP